MRDNNLLPICAFNGMNRGRARLVKRSTPCLFSRMLRTLLTGRSSRFILTVSLFLNVLFFLIAYHLYSSALIGCEVPPVRSIYVPPKTLHYNMSTLSQAVQETVFVGGVPRSGTTLARAMLDAHPDIRCGEETRVIPRVIGMRSRWSKSQKESNRLREAGLSEETLDSATRAFISEIILNHGKIAKYLCNKDPLVLNYMADISRIFPKAKFILMVRDGRAVAYSIVSRNVTISGVDSKNYLSAAMFWNKVVHRMSIECSNNRKRCLMIHYEDLVTDPRLWMRNILSFLEIPWHENVLHHHELIDSEVLLSKLEPSSSQVRKAVNTESVEKWRQKMPLEIQREIYKECDLLKELGYPP